MTLAQGGSRRVTTDRFLTVAIAMASAGAGVIHIGVAGRHLEHLVLVASFLAMAAAQIGLAGLLALQASRRLHAVTGLLNIGVIGLWLTTRLTAVPFVPGLKDAQSVGLADVAATLLEAGAVAFVALALLLPSMAAQAVLTRGRRALVATGVVVFALAVPGLLAPHVHGPAHGHGSTDSLLATHGHEKTTAPTRAHGHSPLNWDQANAVLGHGHGAARGPAVTDGHATHPLGDGHAGSRAPTATAGHGHTSGSTEAGDGHAHEPAEAARPDTVIVAGERWRLVYEPRTKDGTHSAAYRVYDARGHDHHGGACAATTAQKAAGAEITREMRAALKRYDNNPWRALSDGFVAYPIPLSKMFHMVAVGRYHDGRTVDPTRVESFLYAMTDDGLTAVGGMFIYPNKDKAPPNPTGCLMIWHKHTQEEGLATSFDPRSPTESVWMAHVWTYGGLEPWGRDMDGSEPHAWFFAYRGFPVFCNDNGECI